MRHLFLVGILTLAACASPTLSLPEDTPDDFAALAEAVFVDFVAAFPAREDCIEVEIRAAWELEDRAIYDPRANVITVRIPGTAAQLTTSIVHELGHLLEYRCPQQAEVRQAFLDALGLSTETPWPDPGNYETDPSELWAEAVVQHVLDQPDSRRPLPVTPTAVELVGRWARGELSHEPSSP